MKSPIPPQDQDIINILKDLESHKAAYPPELLAARRAAFIGQIAQHGPIEMGELLTPKEQQVVAALQTLKPLEGDYPSKLLDARRSAFLGQVIQTRRFRFWTTWRSKIQNAFALSEHAPWVSPQKGLRTSLIVAGMALVAFVGGFLFLGNRDHGTNLFPAPNGQDQFAAVAATATSEAKIVCKPGYVPPLCLVREIEHSENDLTFQGNGVARPAVAKDTIPGYNEIHRAAYVNDGLYGPGASWVSKSPNSWIKIDLGKPTIINTVAFGRDRLGHLNDHDPGQFVIAVALSDNVYANGDSSNDDLEYTPVYDSKQAGFSGTISGPETVMAQFQSLDARFIKITFENAGTAIDEVEVFMTDTPAPANHSTRTPRESSPSNTLTTVPSSTALPVDTLTPVPTDTAIPSDTPTPLPTDTPIPTDTPVPTDTPIPTSTELVPSPTEIIELFSTPAIP